MVYEHKFKLNSAHKWNKVGDLPDVIHRVSLKQLLKDDLGNVLREEERTVDLLPQDTKVVSAESFVPAPTAESTEAEKDAFAAQLIQWGLDAMTATEVEDYTAEFVGEKTDMLSYWKKTIINAYINPERGPGVPGMPGKQRISKELTL